MKVIIDRQADDTVKTHLQDLGFQTIETIKLPDFDTSLCTHPDIQLTIIGSKIIVDPRAYDYYNRVLTSSGLEILKGDTKVTDTYPKNIPYNVVVKDSLSIHNYKYTDPVVSAHLQTKIDVNQGYSKCNVAVTGEGFITSDKGIYDSLKKRALLIDPGHIKLAGYDYGFIGGATGYHDGVLYTCGSLKAHPSYRDIVRYLQEEDTELVELGEIEITDYGSLFFL